MTNTVKPSREEMIDAIYEKIARKDLSFGCKFQLKTGAITTATGEPSGPFITCLFFQQTRLENIEKIIGHPVMIGDVMDFIHKIIEYKRKYNMTPDNRWQEVKDGIVIFSWKDKRKSIEEQDDKLVRYIYNLIQ